MNLLVPDQKTLSLVKNRTFREAGVGIIGRSKHKGPYIWCVLFSESERNGTFVLEDLGKGIEQKRGCYSGTSLPCSGAHGNFGVVRNIYWICLQLVIIFSVQVL